MKRVNAITFLNDFVSGGLTLLIPLLLLTRNVSLAEIGAVLSVLPLVFLVARLLFAAIADRIGWARIFLLMNWPTTLLSTAIYYFAASLPAFLAGKFVEGLRDSSYWAVSRTAIFHLSPQREGEEATKTNAVIWLATAAGCALAGFGIAYLGFYSTIAILAFASAAIVVPAAMLWKTGNKSLMPKPENMLKLLNPRGKGRTFWLVSLALMLYSFATYPVITLMLPVFMNVKLGYSYLSVGLLFMVYNLIASAVTMVALKWALNFKRAVFQTVVGLIAVLFLTNSGLFFLSSFLALAFVRGLSIAFFEHSVAKVVAKSKNVSVDIGWLHAPMRIAEFLSVLIAGFSVQTIGFGPVFVITGVFFAAFSFVSFGVLNQK
jgi:MFS family permease